MPVKKLGDLSRRAGARLRLWQLCAAGYVLYALLLLPLLGLAPYAWPLSDDYKYGLAAHAALQQGGGLFQALGAAAGATGEYFMTWQGTWAAVFLMALPPFVFGQEAYAVTPVVMLAALTGGGMAFFVAVFRRLPPRAAGFAKGNTAAPSRAAGLAVALVFLLFAVQRAPSPAEGFYWYNGAVYYTFFFALALLLGAAVVLALAAAPGARRRLWLALACVLAALVGGGNYVSGVACLLVFLLALAALLVSKDKRWKLLCLPGGVFLASLLAGLLAPGNALRQAQYPAEVRPGFFRAIWLAVEKAFTLTAGWVDVVLLLALAALCPVIWRALAPPAGFAGRGAGKQLAPAAGEAAPEGRFSAEAGFAEGKTAEPTAERRDGCVSEPLCAAGGALAPGGAAAAGRFAFRFPLLASAGSMAFFAACLFAPIYATGGLGGGRLYNTAYWLMLLVLIFNLTYWLGWLRRKLEKVPGGTAVRIDGFLRRQALPLVLAFSLALGAFVLAGGSWRGTGAAKAAETLAGGHAAEFDRQMQARQALLEDPALPVAELPALTARPELLFITDLTADPGEWINRVTAAYFGKQAVFVAPG